jgi:MGT family glycosyltransferase
MPTVVFFPEGAFGPTNNCVGIGNVLRERGVRVVFVVEESFAGTLSARGFEERVMRLKPKPATPEAPGQFWKDFIRDTAPEFRKSTLAQLETLIRPIWAELIDGARFVNPRLNEIFAELAPDVIVEDNVVGFPAVLSSGVPWVRIASCNPLEVKDAGLPPTFSGYPVKDRSGWAAFQATYDELMADLHRDFDAFFQDHGGPPLPAGEFIHESPYLNLYTYPADADYPRSAPLGETWRRLESCVRQAESAYELPPSFRENPGKLIYLSLGSLGSADVGLMTRLIDALGHTPHRVIVSMGPQHEQLTLAGNMIGAEFLPQTAIIPMVDLVITHGGNNTVTESLHFGKPMVVLPLFWDQHDNAQRVEETGFGVRLAPYTFRDAELRVAIDRLTGDGALTERLRTMSAHLQRNPGVVRAADLIQQVAQEEEPTAGSSLPNPSALSGSAELDSRAAPWGSARSRTKPSRHR